MKVASGLAIIVGGRKSGKQLTGDSNGSSVTCVMTV
jgi:hypothetical protein